MMNKWTTLLSCLALTALPVSAQNQAEQDAPAEGTPAPITHAGSLARGDSQTEDGSYADIYTFEVVLGQTVTIDLTSGDVDTYLLLQSPGGDEWSNDDHEGSLDHSRVEMLALEPGEYTVTATSFESGETGNYNLTIAIGPVPENPPQVQTRTETGELKAGGQTRPNGQFTNTYQIEAHAGDIVNITLDSEDFDTYLTLESNDEDNPMRVDNDDFGSFSRSRIAHTLPTDGSYTIYVTTFSPGEVGDYSLTIQHITFAAEDDAADAAEE